MEAQATRPDDYRAYLALHHLAARYGQPPPEEPPSSVLSVALRVAWKGPAPARQVVDVGSFDLGAIDGFYQSEATEDGTSVRWSRPHARLRIGGLRPESPAMLLIRLRTSSLVEDKRDLLIQSGGITVGQFQPSARWRTYHVLVPRTDAAGVAEVELSMPSLFISNYLPIGDKRNLGVQVDGFSKASLHEQSRQTMSIDVQR